MKQIRFLFIGITAILMIQCKGPQTLTVPVHDSTTIETSETITDNPTWTDPESLLYQFAFECDSAYNVILKQYNELNSGMESSIEVKEVIKWKIDGTKVKQLQLNISALVDAMEVQNRTIERLRKEKRVQQVPYPVPGPEVVRNSKLAKVCIPGFISCIVLLILLAAYKIKTKTLKTALNALK